MTSESPAAIQVTVSQFTLCSCNSSQHEDLHLSVRTFSTHLQRDNAIAVSHGLGDFGRRKLPFGHYEGDPQQKLLLEFGNEWIIDDLKPLLVRLSQDDGNLASTSLQLPFGTLTPDSPPAPVALKTSAPWYLWWLVNAFRQQRRLDPLGWRRLRVSLDHGCQSHSAGTREAAQWTGGNTRGTFFLVLKIEARTGMCEHIGIHLKVYRINL